MKEEAGGVEGGEIVVGMFYMSEESIFDFFFKKRKAVHSSKHDKQTDETPK